MIHVIIKHDCISCWRNNTMYDTKRDDDFKIKFFGITIFKKIKITTYEIPEYKNGEIGFKK